MVSNVKVSVITPVYNGAKTIRDTIESVLNQTYKSIEYIIVDGDSTDGTMDIVMEYEPLFKGRMKYISEKDNGIYHAMNKGIRMSTGQIIGIINSDDYYDRNAVQNIIDHMKNTKYQVIYGYLEKRRGNRPYGTSKRTHTQLATEMIPHPTCFVSRDIYQKYGLYLEWFKISADYEFMLRLIDKSDVVFIQVEAVISYFRIGGISSDTRYYIEDEVARKMHHVITSREFAKRAFSYLKQQSLKWITGR